MLERCKCKMGKVTVTVTVTSDRKLQLRLRDCKVVVVGGRVSGERGTRRR